MPGNYPGTNQFLRFLVNIMLYPNDELEQLLEDDNTTGINQDTARYLQHIEHKLYSDIQARKRIDSGLLFLSCQVSSASLAWFLFSLQISISLIIAISATIALLPGLIDCGESFNFELSSERWGIRHDKPLVAVTKLMLGGIINWHGTSQILSEVWQSEDAIKSTYTEIRQANKDNFFTMNQQDLFPIIGGLIAGIALMIAITRKPKNV